MKRPPFVSRLAATILALVFGITVGWLTGVNSAGKTVERMVAFKWRVPTLDSPSTYGAHVFLVPEGQGFSVRAKVHIDRSGPFMEYIHDCGELGQVATADEAVERWGQIEWRDDGLHLGYGTNHFFLERRLLENHR